MVWFQLTTIPPPKKKIDRECRGECISGLFALLCDQVDEQGTCSDGGVCCITDTKNNDVTTRRPTTTPRPTTPVSTYSNKHDVATVSTVNLSKICELVITRGRNKQIGSPFSDLNSDWCATIQRATFASWIHFCCRSSGKHCCNETEAAIDKFKYFALLYWRAVIEN